MDEIITGGSTFPVVAENGLGHVSQGMTLRQYFAALAMQAMVNSKSFRRGEWPYNDIALQSYEMADAMLDPINSGYKALREQAEKRKTGENNV